MFPQSHWWSWPMPRLRWPVCHQNSMSGRWSGGVEDAFQYPHPKNQGKIISIRNFYWYINFCWKFILSFICFLLKTKQTSWNIYNWLEGFPSTIIQVIFQSSPCPIDEVSSNCFSWFSRLAVLENNTTMSLIYPDRITIIRSGSGYSLNVKPTITGDSGTYFCLVNGRPEPFSAYQLAIQGSSTFGIWLQNRNW